MILNFTNYRFRCSFLPTLMTQSRVKSEVLSETAKAGLREVWIKETYNRQKYDANKYTQKGIMCEPDAMDLVQTVKRKTYFKNKEQFYNDWITGVPDIVTKTDVKDIKCSWDVFTFAAITPESATKAYYYQLLGYMDLTGMPKAELLYCLVNTPEEIMSNELYKLSFSYPEMNESDDKMAKYKRNYVFDDIPAKNRVKSIRLDYSASDMNEVCLKIEAARSYLQGLSL